MDKRKVLQTIKQIRLNYLQWMDRVEAGVAQGRNAKGEEHFARRFGHWYADMANVLSHFEEYRALHSPHQRAYAQYQEIQDELHEDRPKRGWVDRVFSSEHGQAENHRATQLLNGFYREAALVVEHLNRLERRLLLMQPIEWEQHLEGAWELVPIQSDQP